MKKKTTLACLLLTLILLVSFMGCGGNQTPSSSSQATSTSSQTTSTSSQTTDGTDELYPNGLPKAVPVTLKIAQYEAGAGFLHYDRVIEMFAEMYPNVTIEFFKSTDITTIMSAIIASGSDEDMYTAFCDPNERSAMLEAGKFEMLDDLWEREYHDTPGVKIKDLATQAVMDSSFVVGWPDGEKHVMKMPTDGGFYGGLFFDKALFDQKGWNTSPKTWQQFLDLCQTIKDDGMVPIVYPGTLSTYTDYSLGFIKAIELAHAAGKVDEYLPIFMDIKEGYYDNPYVRAAWGKLAELGKLGYFHTGLAAMDHTQAQMQVLQGKVAMVSSMSWIGNEMADAAPEGWEWGYLAVPFRENENSPIYVRASGNNGLLIYAPKPDLEKAWAKEFIVMQCDLEVQALSSLGGYTPMLRKDFTDDPARVATLSGLVQTIMASFEAFNGNYEIHPAPFNIWNIEGAQLANQAWDAYRADITLGTKDPNEVIEECEKMLGEGMGW